MDFSINIISSFDGSVETTRSISSEWSPTINLRSIYSARVIYSILDTLENGIYVPKSSSVKGKAGCSQPWNSKTRDRTDVSRSKSNRFCAPPWRTSRSDSREYRRIFLFLLGKPAIFTREGSFVISKIERIEKGRRGEGRIKLIGSNSSLEILRFKQRCLENVDVLFFFFFKIKTCLHAHLLGKSWTFFRLWWLNKPRCKKVAAAFDTGERNVCQVFSSWVVFLLYTYIIITTLFSSNHAFLNFLHFNHEPI